MISAKVTGLLSLASQFSNIVKVAKAATAASSKKIADEMVEDMQSRVPVESGNLRDSIRAEPNDDGTVTVRAGGTELTTRATASGTIDEAVLVEHGTLHTPARPFFWPVVEAARERLGEDVIASVNDEVGNS